MPFFGNLQVQLTCKGFGLRCSRQRTRSVFVNVLSQLFSVDYCEKYVFFVMKVGDFPP